MWLTAPGTTGRKTKYDLVAVKKSNGLLFNIDSQAPNKVAKEWVDTKEYDKVIPEFTYGDSRIDFYMERGNERYLMEVKANVDTHPEFGVALEEAKAAGVEVLFLQCHVEPDTLEIKM